MVIYSCEHTAKETILDKASAWLRHRAALPASAAAAAFTEGASCSITVPPFNIGSCPRGSVGLAERSKVQLGARDHLHAADAWRTSIPRSEPSG